MPKMKTNKGAAKRFKKLGNGKLKARSAYTSHILTSKTTKRKRNLRKSRVLTGADAKRAQVLIPY